MDYAARQDEFRRRCAERELDAYYLVSRANVRYLSGFTGEDSTLVVTPGGSALVTDSRYVEQAEQEAVASEVICRKGGMIEAVAEFCRRSGVRKLGVTSANVTHAAFLGLNSIGTGLEAVACESGPAEQMRLRKDPEEAASIGAALQLAESSFTSFLTHIEPGRSEKWLAARFDFEMRERGADGAAFETICAVDANASKPHATPTNDLTRPGSGVLIDWGVRLDGYCSDLTRVACIGTIPAKLGELADVVLAAQEAAFRKLAPGVACEEVDAAARAVIARAGYGPFFGHGVGHGVGLEVHEGPRLGHGSKDQLEPGMVVTIEPGVYLPGSMGVHIEEMALITPGGHQLLSTLPRRPQQLGARRT